MSEMRKSPSELRSMFGSNLRTLAKDFASISELSRQLGINRTQFNRYLSGESFPRPDVLARICIFFDVDARILLEPVGQIGENTDALGGPFLRNYVGQGVRDVPEDLIPSGFYRFSQRSFAHPGRYVMGLIRVFRKDEATFLRGFEARSSVQSKGLPMNRDTREFRGLVLRQDDGVAVLVSRRHAKAGSFNFLNQVSAVDKNMWIGYVTRPMRETSGNERVARTVYEHLGLGIGAAKAVGKAAGLCNAEDLLPFHHRLLKVGQPFG